MTYTETLQFLYDQLPMFQRIGSAAVKKDLTNTRRLCEALGHPEHSFRSVHVAGTNGKGSVSHMTASACQAAGYRTGLYTSPHLRDFRERIRINGLPVSQAFVIAFVDRYRSVIEEIRPSFFELTVAMAFDAFREAQVDLAIVEVGMGGRLDSTNVIQPEIALITNIGYDHMEFLGDTLELIATEKAGIIKPGVPVLVGRRQPETHPVFERISRERGAPMAYASQRAVLDTIRDRPGQGMRLHVRFPRREEWWRDVQCALSGWVQRENVALCLAGLDLLRSRFPRLHEQAIRTGLAEVIQRTQLEGRWQRIDEQPLSIVDVAHNEDGLRALAYQASSWPGRIQLVYGASSDKPLDQLLPLLPDGMLYVCAADIPRAMPAATVLEYVHKHGRKGHAYESVIQAWQTARQEASPEDLVIGCGSLFVVAEILRHYPLPSEPS